VTGFDFIVLAILAISALLGLLRGLIKEVLSLTAYLSAFVAAIWWGPTVYLWLEQLIANSLLRIGVAYAAVFIIVLLAMGLVNVTLAAIIRATGLTPADHGLGAMFGLVRGLLIVFVLVALAGYTPLPHEPWWRSALLAPAATQAVRHVKAWLPSSLAVWLPY